ncbi:MAG TPA: hypothetical protein VNL77_16395 [Roseiflexaceae bacterium]|nr:hypothetical protein [Roseiflexaceae bacterium]
MAEGDARMTPERIAEAVRAACLRAALAGYERAATDGLCPEGALEVALDAIRTLDLAEVLQGIAPR